MEPKLDRRFEIVKLIVEGERGDPSGRVSWEELTGDVSVFTQLVEERIQARELEDIVTELETNTEGRFPLIDRSVVGGLPLIPEHGGHDRALLGRLRNGSHESGGSGRRLNAVGVQLLIASGKPLLSGRMRCPVCGRGGEPSVAHVILGECSAGATSRERCEIVRSLERSADAYPWSYDDGEERYESGEELDDDEREGEMRLREVWDDEVEREEEEGAGERQDSRTVEESDEEDGDSDLGNEIDNEDVVESILGERGIGDRVEVKVRWVEGGEETWEPVEAVRDCEGYGRYLRERDRDRRWSRKDAMPLEGRVGAVGRGRRDPT